MLSTVAERGLLQASTTSKSAAKLFTHCSAAPQACTGLGGWRLVSMP